MCVAIILSRIINAVVRDHQQYDRVVKQQFYKWFKKITRLLLLKIEHGEHQQNNWKEHLQFYKISWWWTLLLLSTCIFSLLWHFCEHPWLRIKFLRYVVYKPHLLLLLLLLFDPCLLCVPPISKTCANSFFDRSFVYAAPTQWNALDLDIRLLPFDPFKKNKKYLSEVLCKYRDYYVYHYKSTELVSLYTFDIWL